MPFLQNTKCEVGDLKRLDYTFLMICKGTRLMLRSHGHVSRHGWNKRCPTFVCLSPPHAPDSQLKYNSTPCFVATSACIRHPRVCRLLVARSFEAERGVPSCEGMIDSSAPCPGAATTDGPVPKKTRGASAPDEKPSRLHRNVSDGPRRAPREQRAPVGPDDGCLSTTWRISAIGGGA